MKNILLMIIVLILLPVFAAAQETVNIYAPATPTSIPLLLAARNMENVSVTIFFNHSQAHTLFLRDDAQILVTGLSVGVNFFQNAVPAQIVNSYVSGLTFLVTRGNAVTQFRELQGQEIYLPFEGSPIEEMTKFFAEQEGLIWKQDILPVYAPFPTTVELLKQGNVETAILPEPFASMAAAQEGMSISLKYKQHWAKLTGQADGYPQVGAFVKQAWGEQHPEIVAKLNQELAEAIRFIQQNPEQAISLTKDAFQFPEPLLAASLQHIDFNLKTGTALKEDILAYYQIVGHPLDETFGPFFYLDPQ